MKNFHRMRLWSDDNKKFEAIMKDFYPKIMCITPELEKKGDSDTVYFDTPPIPRDAVKELSAQHPDMTFMAEGSFEDAINRNVYTLMYQNGFEELVGITVNYCWDMLDYVGFASKDRENLKEIMTEIFRRIDPVVWQCKVPILEVYPHDVTISAEQGDYMMQATKRGQEVFDVKVFKKRHTFTWEPLVEVEPF